MLTWVNADGSLSGALTDETQYFLDCVEQGRPPDRAPAEEGKRTISVFEAAKRAAAEGRRVEVEA